jgi:hypothetical protein
MPLTPLPPFRIYIEDNIANFGQLVNNTMKRKINLHLSDPTRRIRAIKFINLYVGKARFTVKGFGLKM